jgi:hypothetical protein
MFRWLAKRFPSAPLHHVIRIDYDEDVLKLTRANRISEDFLFRDIIRIAIHTTDQGPFTEDLFLVITTASTSYWIPHGVAGPLLTRFEEFEGFNYDAFLNAMSCAENNEFQCWSREIT